REGQVIERHACFTSRPQHRADADGLRRTEAAPADRTCEDREWRVRDVIPRREPRAEVRVCAVAVRVAGVLGEHGEDELFERRKVSRWWRIAVSASETPHDRAKPPPIHAASLSGML